MAVQGEGGHKEGMKKTTNEERLRELLDKKDEELGALREERDELQRLVKADPFLWALQGEVPDRGLPVPRLEIECTPHPEYGWQERIATYRLVYRHHLGHVAGVGMSQTIIRGGTTAPIRPVLCAHRPGKIDLPNRDGAHICNDMAELKLPGFAICGTQIDDLSDLAGKPYDR